MCGAKPNSTPDEHPLEVRSYGVGARSMGMTAELMMPTCKDTSGKRISAVGDCIKLTVSGNSAQARCNVTSTFQQQGRCACLAFGDGSWVGSHMFTHGNQIQIAGLVLARKLTAQSSRRSLMPTRPKGSALAFEQRMCSTRSATNWLPN